MKRITKRIGLLLCLGTAAANAGALYMEVSSAAENPEAEKLHAALVARVTACHEPAKSVVTANLIRVNGGSTEKTPLRVVALKAPGAFAIVGDVGRQAVVDIMVSNPEYPNYQPHVLIRGDDKEVRLAGVKRFSASPTDEDVKALIER